VSCASRLVPAFVLVAVPAVVTGCEYFRDTPERRLADRRWRQCAEGLRDVKFERVDRRAHPLHVRRPERARDRVLQCLEAAGRDSLGLPEAIPSAAAGK